MSSKATSARKPLRRSLSVRKRRSIFEKTGGRCHICGDELSLEDFHVDHVMPVRLGGDSSLSNLLAACGDCNRLKSAQRPAKIRDTLRIGIKARTHMKNGTVLGNKLWRSLGVASQLEATPRKTPKLKPPK